MEMKPLCAYAGESWIDIVRVYKLACEGTLLWIVSHLEEGKLHAFLSEREALEFIRNEVYDAEKIAVGPCP